MEDATRASRMFAAIDQLTVPVVGRVHGAAIGGGAGLVAVCDVVVAEAHATFGFTEVKLGIIPPSSRRSCSPRSAAPLRGSCF